MNIILTIPPGVCINIFSLLIQVTFQRDFPPIRRLTGLQCLYAYFFLR